MRAQGWSQKIQLCHLHGQPSADAWFQPTLIHILSLPCPIPSLFLYLFPPSSFYLLVHCLPLAICDTPVGL